VKKAVARLDAEQREALLYQVDLGLAICSAALVVSVLQAIVGLVT
jgi:ABC-type nickel/cobalt efflux system permease component RcnA